MIIIMQNLRRRIGTDFSEALNSRGTFGRACFALPRFHSLGVAPRFARGNKVSVYRLCRRVFRLAATGLSVR